MTRAFHDRCRGPRLADFFPCMTLVFIALFWSCTPEPASRSVCTDVLGCVWVERGEPVKVISLHTFTGPLASLSEEHVRNMEMHIAERSGIHGHPVTIIREDEQCSPSGGLVAAQKIAADPKVVAIHGPNCSSAAVPASRILSEAGMVMVSGTATAPSLTSVGGEPGANAQPGFFRTVANDQYQGVAAAAFANGFLGRTRAAVVHDHSSYARGLVEAFSEAFRARGGEVVYSGVVGRGDQNMYPLVQAMASHTPELLFMPIFMPEAEHLVWAVRSTPELEKMLLLSADSTLNRPFLEICGSACQGMFFIAPDPPDGTTYEAFLDRYSRMFGPGPEGSFHAHSYDAATILLHALERASFPEPDGSLRIERQRVRDVLSGLREFPGVTGSLSCDAHGDCGVPRFRLVRHGSSMDFEQILRNPLAIHAP
ncbi:MAG: ABC transporter substrate-binding protein [Desulfovibrionales bacterium]|nr:MAG: ABC transporter substrate-binding protein [Desulfovibrionales bacterium]